jgi:hypothetical protein
MIKIFVGMVWGYIFFIEPWVFGFSPILCSLGGDDEIRTHEGITTLPR